MLSENINKEIPVFSGSDITQILDQAKKSHENYLIKSNIKDLDRALVYYLEAIKLNPQLPEVHYKLASLLWEKGEIDLYSAIQHCKKAVKLAPYSSNARLYLGYFLKAADRLEEAEKNFYESIVLSNFRSSRPRLVLSATILQRINRSGFNPVDLLKSIYYFSTGILTSVYDVEMLKMFLKNSFEKISILKYQLSAEFFKFFRNYKKTVQIYRTAAEKTGRSELFYSKTGDLFIELQNPQKAADYYRQLLAENPDNKLMWAKLAEILEKNDKKNVTALIDCYQNIARLEPENSKIFYELGHLYLRSENKFNSVNSFKKAIELEPKNAFYHNSLAYALVQLQDYDGAINEYQQAIRLNPDNGWTSIVSQALGAIYHQVKDNIDAAIVCYQTSILLDKNNFDAHIALGETYQDKNDYDNAINCFCGAIKLNSGCSKLYCNLGLLLWEKGYIEESIVAYQKAISIKPDYAIALNNLGVVYLDGCCKAEESIEMFSLAIKHNPNYTLAYYNKARAFQEKGLNTEAAEFFQMALDINSFTEDMEEEDISQRIYDLFCA